MLLLYCTEVCFRSMATILGNFNSVFTDFRNNQNEMIFSPLFQVTDTAALKNGSELLHIIRMFHPLPLRGNDNACSNSGTCMSKTLYENSN